MKDCYDKSSGAGLTTEPIDYTSEHQTVKSRLTGHDVEIEFSPMGGGKIPYNPFLSKKQMKYMFAAENRGEIKKGTAEKWAHETPNIPHLPERVKHQK